MSNKNGNSWRKADVFSSFSKLPLYTLAAIPGRRLRSGVMPARHSRASSRPPPLSPRDGDFATFEQALAVVVRRNGKIDAILGEGRGSKKPGRSRPISVTSQYHIGQRVLRVGSAQVRRGEERRGRVWVINRN